MFSIVAGARMRIVVAPDSFKDSLSAKAVAEAINRGLLMELPDAEVAMCPMADGGEGTIEAILDAVNGERCHAQVTGPLGAPVDASWAWLPNTSTAIIEMAEASGLQLIPRHLRDASRATSFGTGELIAAALDAGAKRIVLTIGGSATNDAGAGMLRALGVRFFGPSACELEEGGLALSELARIDLSGADPRIRDTQFEIAADVDNPLCGPNGASYIFGAQKGASESQIAKLDDSLVHFANECARVLGIDWRDIPGAGAAGGMGCGASRLIR
jgi:glycerate kinase